MSSKKTDPIASLKPGRYDYKIRARVIRKWRGSTRTGEIFKPFNILLIDNMKSRIHAFIPTACVDKLEDQIQVGKVYNITNFTVQPYKETDIYRCLRMENQLMFSRDTKFEEIDKTTTNIQFEIFDLYDHSELTGLAQQRTFLTDVVGIIKKIDFRDIKNSQGKNQFQAKLMITDGSSTINVTFWDQFAANLQACMNQGLENPVIIIISSGKVGLWNENVEISNVGATRFYLNYKHHSVTQLRKKLSQPEFAQLALTQPTNKRIELLTVDEITKLGKPYIGSQVMAHVNITSVDESNNWFINECTTCQRQAGRINGLFICSNCPRTVPHPDKRYKINVAAVDPTGGIDIILGDREVRTLIGKRARDLYDEVHIKERFPQILKSIAKRNYTVILQIKEVNVVDHFPVYWSKNICNGFLNPEPEQTMNPSQPSSSQVTSSSYQVQGLSDLNFHST